MRTGGSGCWMHATCRHQSPWIEPFDARHVSRPVPLDLPFGCMPRGEIRDTKSNGWMRLTWRDKSHPIRRLDVFHVASPKPLDLTIRYMPHVENLMGELTSRTMKMVRIRHRLADRTTQMLRNPSKTFPASATWKVQSRTIRSCSFSE